MTAQPRHLHRLLAFFDPLLRCPTLVVEPHHRPAGQAQVRDDEAHSWEQLALVMLHLGNHPAGLLPTRCLVERALVLDQGPDTGPSHKMFRKVSKPTKLTQPGAVMPLPSPSRLRRSRELFPEREFAFHL